jgi:hypothetical protein
VPGLPESQGGSYKTKVLKPMANVTEDDILDNLPPAFEGGRRTMERVCIYARDVMIAQITQLFGDGSDDNDSAVKDRTAMAMYLQACLQDYIAAGCKPPPVGEPFVDIDSSASTPTSKDDSNEESSGQSVDDKKKEQPQPTNLVATSVATTTATAIPSKGNIVIRRKTDDDAANKHQTSSYGNGSTTSIRVRQPPRHERAIHQALGQQQIGGSNSTISSLFDREHAPGIRKPGCPCCDPDNPAALADSFMMM